MLHSYVGTVFSQDIISSLYVGTVFSQDIIISLYMGTVFSQDISSLYVGTVFSHDLSSLPRKCVDVAMRCIVYMETVFTMT